MSINTYPTLGACLRAWRTSAGLSQQALAEKIGQRIATISDIETGRVQMSLQTQAALSRYVVFSERAPNEWVYNTAASNVAAVSSDSPTAADLMIPTFTQYVHAGHATPTVEDEAQWFNVSQHYRNTVTVTVRGDSMIDAGIEDGDKVVIRLRPTATSGDIVLASLNNQLTLKGYYKDPSGLTWLVPANPDYDKIVVQPTDDFEIRGVMIEVIRKARRGWWHGIIKIPVVVSLCLLFTACARFQPNTYTFENERHVQATPEQVTERLTQWCAANGWAVTTSAGGVISATSDLSTWVNAYDCGEHAGGAFISRDGTLSIVITAAGSIATTTRVQVVFRATPPRGTMSVACASTGVVEAAVLDAAAR